MFVQLPKEEVITMDYDFRSNLRINIYDTESCLTCCILDFLPRVVNLLQSSA